VLDAGQPSDVHLPTHLQSDAGNARFHRGDQLALNSREGNATHTLRHVPGLHRRRRAGLGATDEGAFNVHPPQALSTHIPYGGLPYAVWCVGDELVWVHEKKVQVAAMF
jgi:hypothetical protein